MKNTFIQVMCACLVVGCIGRTKNAQCYSYGDFGFQAGDTSAILVMDTNNQFVLSLETKSFADIVELTPVLQGVFENLDTLVQLADDEDNKYLFIVHECGESIRPIVPFQFGPLKLLTSDTLYANTGYYPNGTVKFTGGWCQGKKCGWWRTVDNQGIETSTFYPYGIDSAGGN